MTARDLAPGLYWTVKESFVRYVTAGAGGSVWLGDGAEADETGLFRFPASAARYAPDTNEAQLAFDGDIRFSGHFGMLSVPFREPEVILGPLVGELTIRYPPDAAEPTRRTIAVFENPPQAVAVEGFWIWPPLSPLLTVFGSELFGDVYPPGAALDPLKIAIEVTQASGSAS